MSFLNKLADQISSQFSLGDNNNNSLDMVDPLTGKQEKYGALGDFAKKVDQSAERRYVEEGYLRRDPYNTNPKQFEILLQEPSATVLLKKRMFSSIAENFRPDFMDKDEKLYYKAMRILFQNKCNQISAIEKLSKIEKISSAVGNFNEQLMPLVFSLTDTFSDGLISDSGLGSNFGLGAFSSSNPFAKPDFSKFVKTIDKIRRVYSFNTTNKLTTWITDANKLFASSLGDGTGVIEITNFTNLSTGVGTTLNSGNCNFSISDPYELMLITEWDIEKAISDATNSFYRHKSFQFGQSSIEQIINDNMSKLSRMRAGRKASPIQFKVTPDTVLGKRVAAIIERNGTELLFAYDSTAGTGVFPGIGGFTSNSVSISNEFLRGGEVAGYDGLDSSSSNNELAVFKSIITSIYSKIQLEANSRNAIIVNNKNTNYARRKLRFNFSGKLIIQPQDTVHIYISSKSRYDNRVLSGLNNMLSGNGVLQNINKTFTDLKTSVDLAFNPNNINIQVEKSVYVGDDFPNYLWSIMRNQFVTEHEGTHVFAGVVNSANSSWAEGRFTVSVSCDDNTSYLNKGKINFKPGADTFNGAIFDPLTPFKTSFDSVTTNFGDKPPVLLDENQYLLSPDGKNTKTALVRFKSGPYAGNKAASNNLVHDQSIDPINGITTRTYYAPDGLVYKWKEGIGVFTQFGSSLDLNDPNKVGNPNTFQEPFAGQDIMNVLSLLVTGQPYNFATYWNAAVKFQGFSNDPQSLQAPIHSFLSSLRQDLTKSNLLWGNFIPFKNLTISEQAYASALQNTLQITTLNQKIEENLKKFNELNSQAEIMGVANLESEQVGAATVAQDALVKLKASKDALYNDINNQIKELQEKSKTANYLSDIGGDVTFDFDEFVNSDPAAKQAADPRLRRFLRRKLNELTRRMSYNVRANEDKNLFIVDDFYDKDYDILAYDAAIQNSIELYNQEFNSVRDKVDNVSKLLNLEVFADTQGHIRVRPPQYNRMPSSVFYRMMYMKQTLGVQIFPEFLNEMFNDQITTLVKRVEILEDLIRLDCAVLGYDNDHDAMVFITSTGIDGLTAIKNFGETFVFVSSQNGLISDIPKLLNSANPDVEDSNKDQTFVNLQKQATSTKPIFTNEQRYNTLVNALKKSSDDGLSTSATYSFPNDSVVDNLISRIQTKSGQKIQRTFFTKNNGKIGGGIEFAGNTTLDLFKITSDLSDKLKERQKVIKLLYSAIKNSAEFKSLDNDDGTLSNRLMMPGLFGNQNIPEIFEHMIQDESYDDYGPGSGNRYIIKRSQIRSMNIYENPPDYTMVEVHGYLNTFTSAGENQSGDLAVPGFGNGMTTAVAVDYDLWRNYGFLTPSALTVPFLNDPISQCAPFATMLLSQARKNIFRGTITISGNEYMQPGEVVFIEDRGMLFYVNKVSHNYSYSDSGGNFTTTLDLTYGHSPGEYIPTTLDIFGKLIYKNKDIASYAIQRQSGFSNDINMGALIKPGGNVPSSSLIAGTDNKSPNPVSSFNEQVINNTLFTAANVINANNTQGNLTVAKLELRIYHDGNVDTDLQNFAIQVSESFLGNNTGPKKYPTPPSLGTKKDGYVQIVPVDLTSDTEYRSPSQKALDLAREQLKMISVSGGGASAPTATSDGGSGTKPVGETDNSGKIREENDRLRTALFKYIIDCWITFENKGTTQSKAGS